GRKLPALLWVCNFVCIPALDLLNLPDADVVALAQQGRESAFRELIRRYERPVFSLIYRMVRDRELAEDLAQDTFIKVLNHIDRYRPEFKLSSWLFKIANNVAIDHLRRRQLDTISMDGSPHASTSDAIESTSFEVAVPQESALDELEAKELGSAIEQAISQLRPEYRRSEERRVGKECRLQGARCGRRRNEKQRT